jgi:hypothetical protein
VAVFGKRRWGQSRVCGPVVTSVASGVVSIDDDITSMDTTLPIRWSWSSTYFRTTGKHLLATVVTASYGFQFGSSTTP